MESPDDEKGGCDAARGSTAGWSEIVPLPRGARWDGDSCRETPRLLGDGEARCEVVPLSEQGIEELCSWGLTDEERVLVTEGLSFQGGSPPEDEAIRLFVAAEKFEDGPNQ